MKLNIDKVNIDDYIKCPRYFALNSLKPSEQVNPDDDSSFDEFKKLYKKSTKNLNGNSNASKIEFLKYHITKIAMNELKTGTKLDITQYRCGFANKFYNNVYKTTVNGESIIDKTNTMFSLFHNGVFLAYNMPLEIPISKTNIMFSACVDFILADNDEIFTIDIIDSTIINLDGYRYWSHYKVPYLFVANNFGKKITSYIIDINDLKIHKYLYYSRDFKFEMSEIQKLAINMINLVYVKNLYQCKGCKYIDKCIKKDDN